MGEPDEELMARVNRRDPAAFEEVLNRHGEAVRAHLNRMLRDTQTAEDLAQEVFLRVWTRGEQYAGQGSLGGWMMKIATNLAINHLRSVRRRRVQPLRPKAAGDENGTLPAWMVDGSALGPDAAAETAERAELLRGLVAGLPAEKREVLRLVHEEQMNIAEAARVLGIPEGTAKSRLFYAARKLAERWRE